MYKQICYFLSVIVYCPCAHICINNLNKSQKKFQSKKKDRKDQ